LNPVGLVGVRLRFIGGAQADGEVNGIGGASILRQHIRVGHFAQLIEEIHAGIAGQDE
jgi:hypothetical protein